ncbi:hypothetical protein ACJX0J_039305, partial [Zea mays]
VQAFFWTYFNFRIKKWFLDHLVILLFGLIRHDPNDTQKHETAQITEGIIIYYIFATIGKQQLKYLDMLGERKNVRDHQISIMRDYLLKHMDLKILLLIIFVFREKIFFNFITYNFLF